LGGGLARAADAPALPKAFIDGVGPGWKELAKDDFVNVNCAPDTWSWKDGIIYCTGTPVGVLRTAKQIANFELVVQWKHLKSAGNSGVFVWGTEESLNGLKPNQLPHGIEVQVLDHGYTERYEKQSGKKADWFTTPGDVLAVEAVLVVALAERQALLGGGLGAGHAAVEERQPRGHQQYERCAGQHPGGVT